MTDDRPADGGHPAPEPSGEAFVYRESAYTNPEELAIALMADWGNAARWFFQPRDRHAGSAGSGSASGWPPWTGRGMRTPAVPS